MSERRDDGHKHGFCARLQWLMADPATVTDELVAIRQAIYAQPGFAASKGHVRSGTSEPM